MQPKDEDELVDMLHTSLQLDGPGFVRYPRGAGNGVTIKETPATLAIGKAEVIREGTNIMIWALGPMITEALKLSDRLQSENGLSVGVINGRFAKPLDETLLHEHAKTASLIVTMEDHVVTGGFGSAVLESLQAAHSKTDLERIGWPDRFVEHGSSVEILRGSYGLAPDDIYCRVLNRWQSLHSMPVEADA